MLRKTPAWPAVHAMIDEANVLGAMPVMRIDAVKALQQRWQHEAQSVPVERKQEQKLWDAFRKPIDDAFNRKSAEREQAAAAMSVHDKAVLDAVKALDAANASGDVQKIRAAIAAVEAAGRGQAWPLRLWMRQGRCRLHRYRLTQWLLPSLNGARCAGRHVDRRILRKRLQTVAMLK